MDAAKARLQAWLSSRLLPQSAVTEEFPPETPPEHPGFYWTRWQEFEDSAEIEGWAHWDGMNWGMTQICVPHPEYTWLSARKSRIQRRYWRGLNHETPTQSLS